MSIPKESLAIFKRNPWTSTVALLLMIGAAAGQVVSLSSLYPILQTLVPDQNGGGLSGPFVSLLEEIGAAPTFGNLLLVFIVLGVVYSVLNWAADAFQDLQVKKFESAVRQELFGSLVRAKWTYARDLRHGEFLNVITRETGRYTALIKYLLLTLVASLQFAALLGYALYLNWQLTALGVLMFSAGGLVLAPILRWATALGHTGSELSSNMYNRLIAALRSLKMVKALSLETFMIRTMQPSFEATASNACYSRLLSSGQYAVMEIIAVVAVSSMLYAGLILTSIPKAQLMVILLLLFRALPQVRLAIHNYHQVHGFSSSMQIMREHLAAALKAGTRHGGVPISPTWSRIDFRKIGFAYDGRPLFENLSLSIGRGEFWAVVGASGSGKSTLLDLLIGLLDPQSGRVSIDDIALDEADLDSWHAQIAYLGQDAFVFAGTVRDNLAWGNEVHGTDSELLTALRAAKLDAAGSFRPEILDRNAGENGCNLSGGEKQRLALARLFLRQPSLVILDEPTTGLDASMEKDILESILSYFRNTTFIMVTHREELTREADHVIRFTSEGVEVEAGVGRGLSGSGRFS